MKRTALVTGGNRGIGLAVGRQLSLLGHRVILSSRDADAGERAAAELRKAGLDIVSHVLDVTEDASVQALVDAYPQVDILINNAGVKLETDLPETAAADVLHALNSNVVGAHRLMLAYTAQMRRQGWGRVVNVSSEMSQSDHWNAYAAIYRVTKAALNTLTVGWADELRGTGVLVNAVSPGWVQTRMGGSSAPRTVEQGASSILYAVHLPDDGPTGTLTQDGKTLAW